MLGIAFSGGGARGAAHVGALKALEEAGLRPEAWAGTSAGSLVAALGAMGYSADRMRALLPLFEEQRLLDFDGPGIARMALNALLRRPVRLMSLCKGKKLEATLEEITRGARLEELETPLFIPAVDIRDARIVLYATRCVERRNPDYRVVREGALSRILLASMALPVIFPPVQTACGTLVDGGLRLNVPVSPLRSLGCARVIAVQLGYAGARQQCPEHLLDVGAQSLSILFYQASKLQVGRADWVVNPHIYDVSSLTFGDMGALVERGYAATKAALNEKGRSVVETIN